MLQVRCCANQACICYLSLVPSSSRSPGVPGPAAAADAAAATDAAGCSPSFDATGCLKEDVRRPTALHVCKQLSHRPSNHNVQCTICMVVVAQGLMGHSNENHMHAHLRPEGSVVTHCCWMSECPSRGEVCGR